MQSIFGFLVQLIYPSHELLLSNESIESSIMYAKHMEHSNRNIFHLNSDP